MTKHVEPLIIIMGKSGTGKTSVATYLHDKLDWQQIESYTTRPRRTAEEAGHHFISDAEFDQIPANDRIAYMEYCGYRYCAKREQLDEADLYVVTPDGYESVKAQYQSRPLITVLLTASEETLKNRMRMRGGNTEDDLNKKIQQDNVIFQNVEADVTLATDRLSVQEIGDIIVMLSKFRIYQTANPAKTATLLSNATLLNMCDEIFYWKYVYGILPAGSPLKSYATVSGTSTSTAERLILDEASRRFRKLIVLLMSERPSAFLNCNAADDQSAK